MTPPTLLELCHGWPEVTPSTVAPWVQSVHCMHNLPSPIKYNGLAHTVFVKQRAACIFIYHTIIRQISVSLSVYLSVIRFARKPFTRFASNSADVLLGTDDAPFICLSLYGCGQIIELIDFCVLFAAPSTPMLCYECGVPV